MYMSKINKFSLYICIRIDLECPLSSSPALCVFPGCPTTIFVSWFRNHHFLQEGLIIIHKEPPFFQWWLTSRYVYIYIYICNLSPFYYQKQENPLTKNHHLLTKSGVWKFEMEEFVGSNPKLTWLENLAPLSDRH